MTDVSRKLGQRQKIAIVGVGVLASVTLVALAGRLVHINTSLSSKLANLRQGQYVSKTVLPARRGTIFDSRGRVLAGSRELFGVFADPGLVADVESVSARLATILEMEAGEIEQAVRARASKRFCWIKRRVPAAESEAIRRAGLAGIGLQSEPVRHYPLGSLAGQVLGFVGADGRGLEGLELLHDAWLSGKAGQAWVLRNPRREALTSAVDERRRDEPARDGGHILLTIDSAIQSFVEQSLSERVEHFEALRGVAVVMDPRNGDVLAMANYPGYGPGDYAQAPAERRRNRVVTDMAEPGSIFKPFVASAALAEGVVRRGEMFNTHNGLYVIGKRLLHDDHPYGYLSFENIVAKSSNIGMAQLGERLGNDALYRSLRRFGFGQRTGIDFLGEAIGSLQPLSKWTSYTTSSVPMGQEIAATPLQLMAAFCAIVNDGVLLKPRLVRAKLSPEGQVREEFTGPNAVRRVLPAEVARYFTETVLVAVVNGTTSARHARVDGYQVLGKTGTAQMAYLDRRGYEPNAYMGSFIGAAPARDPQVAVLMMIERPNPAIGYYGGVMSAPAVSDILTATLAYLRVPKDGELLAVARPVPGL